MRFIAAPNEKTWNCWTSNIMKIHSIHYVRHGIIPPNGSVHRKAENNRQQQNHIQIEHEREVEKFCTLIGSYSHWKAEHCRCAWKTEYSLYELQFGSLAFKNAPIAVEFTSILLSRRSSHIAISLTYRPVCRCVRVCVLLRFNICLWVLRVVALAYVLAITFARRRCCCFLFTLVAVSLSYVRVEHMETMHVSYIYDICFRFFRRARRSVENRRSYSIDV